MEKESDISSTSVDFANESSILLSYEEQRYKLDVHLRQVNKYAQPVERNASCIFQSLQIGFQPRGMACNVGALKDSLKNEIVSNIPFYQQLYSESVDVIREVNGLL